MEGLIFGILRYFISCYCTTLPGVGTTVLWPSKISGQEMVTLLAAQRSVFEAIPSSPLWTHTWQHPTPMTTEKKLPSVWNFFSSKKEVAFRYQNEVFQEGRSYLNRIVIFCESPIMVTSLPLRKFPQISLS